MAVAPGVRLFGVTLHHPSKPDGPSTTPSDASGDSSGGAAAGTKKRGADAVDSRKPDAVVFSKRIRLDHGQAALPADKAASYACHDTAWPPEQPGGRSPDALPPVAETLAVSRAAGDAPKQRDSPGSTCGRSSLNSGSSTFSVGHDAATASGALHRTQSLPRPVATHAAVAAPTPITAAAAPPHPAATSAAAGSTLRLSAATAFAPYAAPPQHPVPQPVAALHRQLQAAVSGENPFAGDIGMPFGQQQQPIAYPVPRRPARRPSSKRASLDSHASSDVAPTLLEGSAVTLDGKTAAERRRETLAIQATLPPDLKICSSCRQIKSRDQYHACRAKKDQLQDRCKACRASLDAVRTALARPTNAAARPVGALALERATRSSEPFMRSTAALITQSGRSSCRRASEPVHAQPAGRSAPCVSTPSNKGGSAMQVALSSIREDPAGQMYQAAAHSAAAAAAMMPPPAWNGAQHRRPAPPPPPFYHHVPQQPRSRLGGYTQPQTAARTSSTRVQAPMAAMPPPALEASKARWTLAALVCLSSSRRQLSVNALGAALGVSSAAGLLLAAAAACGLAQR